jgi:predicted nuclease of restriction endonuclease-like RecB superfamily
VQLKKVGTATVISQTQQTKRGSHKYGAVPQVEDGIRFDSTKEAKRYRVLKHLEAQGKISELKLQPKFNLVLKCVYKADFEYVENGNRVIEDVKGYKTREYLRKRKLMKEQHGITIKET